MALCILATDSTVYLPGENHRCENPAYYIVPGELGEYLLGAHVCKLHLKYLLKNGEAWIRIFRESGVTKGQMVEHMQDLYRKQSIWSELS